VSDAERTTLVDERGRSLLTYLPGTRNGQPWADLVELADDVSVDQAVSALLRSRAGWAVSSHQDFGQALVDRGATILRHAHAMSWDLVAAPVRSSWRTMTLPDALHLGQVTPDARRIVRSHALAYPAMHPDHDMLTDAAALQRVLDGEWVGTLSTTASAWICDESDEVVAGLTVTVKEGGPPFAGPWVADVWRIPTDQTRGLGAVLLRRAAAVLLEEGFISLGLAVTAGNPARRLYERLGFVTTDSSMTVSLP
jgi:GNAT superfamily N-acetyltransferase